MNTLDSLEQQFEMAAGCFMAKQYEESRIRCHDLLHQYPFIADLHNLLALNMFKLDQFDSSLLHAEAAAKLAPDREDFLLSLADIHFEMKNYLFALKCYQTLTQNNPINREYSSRVDQCSKHLR